jgi:hypothetical protein
MPKTYAISLVTAKALEQGLLEVTRPNASARQQARLAVGSARIAQLARY